LERIGDYAVGIARIVIMIGDEPTLKPLIDIPRMAEKTVDMLSRALMLSLIEMLMLQGKSPRRRLD